MRLHFTKPFGVGVQLREHVLQLVDVDVQYTFEKLAANFLEPHLQVRHDTPPPACRLDDREPMIARIAPARKKPARLEPVHEPRNLAFVPAHDPRELSRGGFSFLRTMHQHRRFLCRHPKLAEATIERRLQPYAGAKEPGYRELSLPLSDPGELSRSLLPSSGGIPQKSLPLSGLGRLRHPFGRHDFSS